MDKKIDVKSAVLGAFGGIAATLGVQHYGRKLVDKVTGYIHKRDAERYEQLRKLEMEKAEVLGKTLSESLGKTLAEYLKRDERGE